MAPCCGDPAGRDHTLRAGLRPDPFNSLLDSCIRCDPVHFPALAAVAGKRLLEAAHVGGLALDDELHEDRAAVQRVLVVELAAAVPELADRRDRQRAAAAVREIQ